MIYNDSGKPFKYKITSRTWIVYSDSAKDALDRAREKSDYYDSYPEVWRGMRLGYRDISFIQLINMADAGL